MTQQPPPSDQPLADEGRPPRGATRLSIGFILKSNILELFEDEPDLASGSGTQEATNVLEAGEVSNLNYVSPPTYRMDSNYNYYTDFYEDISRENSLILEAGLPNLYIYGDDENRDVAYRKYITVEENVKIEEQNSNSNYEYFDAYASKYQNSLLTNDINSNPFLKLSKQQDLIYFTEQGLKRFSDINKNQVLMPYSIKIDFKPQELSLICGFLEQTKFTDIFCNAFINYIKKYFEKIDLNITSKTYTTDSQGNLTTTETTNLEMLSGKIFKSIQDFVDQILSFIPLRLFEDPVGLNLGNILNANEQVNNGVGQSFYQSSSISLAIRRLIFRQKMIEFVNLKKLDPREFVHGVPFYSETLMFQLNKLSEENLLLQQFYMANLNNLENIEFFDSQVKFAKNYIYSLMGYNFSLGQQINTVLFDELETEEWDSILERMCELNSTVNDYFTNTESPSYVNIVRVNELDEPMKKLVLSTFLQALLDLNYPAFIYKPTLFGRQMFSDVMAVYDHPPPPPEIEIDGLIGVDNELIIRLNGSISEFKASPIIIQPEDVAIFNKNAMIQKVDLTDPTKTLMFDGDDRPIHFQIFRIEHHPRSYADFKDNYVTASTTHIMNQGTDNYVFCDTIKAYNTSYIDKVSPNKKYYYIFRTVDIHGNISNPSPIYQVEVINSDGTIFPIIKIVDFAKEDGREPSKSVKRFLYITPNALQTIVNESRSGYFNEDGTIKDTAELVKNNVFLGYSDNTVWNKKFRLKIRSKLTGKIIEIDFKYTYKTLPNPANCE